jgi:hypothetical protein
MKRITRNERIKDIEPERERGPAVLKFIRGDADHDPMFPRPKGAWVSGLNPLPASPTPATPEPVQKLQEYYEQLPPPPPEQHNDHVMNYWNWRLDRLEAKRHG